MQTQKKKKENNEKGPPSINNSKRAQYIKKIDTRMNLSTLSCVFTLWKIPLPYMTYKETWAELMSSP